MSYRLLVALIFVALYTSFLVDSSFGFSAGSSGTYAEMSPWHLATWVVALLAFLLPLWLKDPYNFGERRAGLIRRFFGFALDFHVCFFLVFIPFIALVLLGESSQVGAFIWHVERSSEDVQSSWMVIIFLVATLAFVTMLSVPLYANRRSAGQIVLGYGLKSQTEMSLLRACGRTLVGYLTLCAGAISIPMAAVRKDRRMWHDQMYEIYALEVCNAV